MPIYTFALFDDKTAELVNIRPLFISTDKPIQIYMQSFNSPKVKESAKTGIECAYEALFSCENIKYKQTEYISVIPKDFKRKVDGSSAGLAYAVAFITQLINWNKIECPVQLPRKIAATGVIDNSGNISGVNFMQQKILAAIEHNVELVLFPSQNYEEVETLLRTNSEFNTMVKNSQIKLKHVSNINQVLCELGIFTKPYIDISCSGISSSNETSYKIILYNQARLGFYNFQLEFNYDNTCLELAEVYINNNLIKGINKNPNKILLTYDCENDISYMIKDSITIAEIGFRVLSMPIDVQNTFAIKANECRINSYPCKLMGGMEFCSNAGYKNNAINIAAVSDNRQRLEYTDIDKSINSKIHTRKSKLKYILGIFVFVSLFVLSTLVFNSMKRRKISLIPNSNATTISQAPTDQAKQTPLNTVSSVVKTSNSPSVAPSLTKNPTSPEPTPGDSPGQFHTPYVTETPSMPVNTVLTPTKTPRPTPTHTLVPTNTPEPSNVLAPVKITGLLDHANWAVAGKSNATISLESTQINSRNVLSIDYSIAGNGNASIKTRENSIAFPEDRSKLIFAYKCSSQNSLRDSITIIINYFDNKSERINLGSSEEISSLKNWATKEIPLKGTSKVNSIEIFIGNLFNQGTETNKGVLMLSEFFMY
ncbi:MAG: hypothetical protein GX383_03710 [Clostridium sp.]|nr:hypothetical protein [Clostridium sp.]